MWRLTPIEPGQSCDGARQAAGAAPNDGSPIFWRLLAKSRAAMIAYAQAENTLAKGVLPQLQREKIALAVAEINGSNYCLAAHEASARQAGLSTDDIKAARKASASDFKTETLLHFVQAIVLQRGDVSDGDFFSMRKAGFSDEEIIEVLANVVLNIFSNYFNILAQTDVDHSLTTGPQSPTSRVVAEKSL